MNQPTESEEVYTNPLASISLRLEVFMRDERANGTAIGSKYILISPSGKHMHIVSTQLDQLLAELSTSKVKISNLRNALDAIR